MLTDDDRPVMLVSAGVGATPVLAMLHQLAAQRSTREVWWIHTARDAQQHAFAEESARLLAALPNSHRHVVYTATEGRLTPSTMAGLGLPADASAYLCGPAGFMAGMQDTLTALGMDPGSIHVELFGARSAINPGVTDVRSTPPHQPPGPAGTGPRVTFARSGLTVRAGDGSQTLLELAESCDVPTRWSCRTGVCHTCVTPVLTGAVRYSPAPLEPPDPDEALICCSQPDADLVLDL